MLHKEGLRSESEGDIAMPRVSATQVLLRAGKRLDQRLHRMFSGRSDLLANPLFGDRSIEYAFVIEELAPLNRDCAVLDVGCCGSPLTTVIRGMGFRTVHGIDLLPPPVAFPGVDFFAGDFLTSTALAPFYDVVVFCSSIEHFGLEGRYRSKRTNDGDLRALRRGIDMLPEGGALILTVPYGVERIIAPWHRVYNKSGNLLKYALGHLRLRRESFFARDGSSQWTKCTEAQAASVVPTASSYALGLFAFVVPQRAAT